MKLAISPHLFFDGRCREAFEHYARLFGGEITFLMLYGGSPAEQDVPAEWRDKVLHAALTIGDQVIMGCDAPPGRQKTPQGFSTSMTVASVADAERLFAGLSAGGHVLMPLSETFFAERFAMLTDRYGMSWMVSFPGAVGAHNTAAQSAPPPQRSSGKTSVRSGKS